MEDFETTVERLRALGDQLVPYNAYPKLENDIFPLKTTPIVVDGYEFDLYFHKAPHENMYFELARITPIYSIFLPFSVVAKVARKILGGHHLSFVQYFTEDNRRTYCWSVYVDDRGRPQPSPFKNATLEHRVFEGLEYDVLDPKELNIY